MKTSFNLKDLWNKLKQNVSLTLLLALVVLGICAGLIIKRSVAILLAAQHVEATPKTQSVRVNFGLYNSIADRFSKETAFTPTQVTAKDPFGTLDFEVKQP